jgi:VWFA-related protein
MRIAPIVPLLILVSLSATSGWSNYSPQAGQPQSASPPTASPSTASNGTDRQITLYVQVAEKSGAPVRGLQKGDFVLRDNNNPQTITSFYGVNGRPAVASDPPVEVIVAIDNINATFTNVSYERDQIKRYLLRNGGELPQQTSLIVVTDTGTSVQRKPSKDGKALAAFYDQYEIGLRSSTRSQGLAGAEERASLSLNALNSIASYARTVPGRKLLIWISPGWPLFASPNITQLTLQNQKLFFRAVVGISTALERARITLYSVDPLGIDDAASYRTNYYKTFLKGAPFPKQTQVGDLGLQVLAVQSGGVVRNSSNDLVTAIVACVADADSYYVLTFDPPLATHPDEYHTLEVTVEKPGVIARTRTLYYNQP